MTQKISRNDYFKLISETGRIPKDDEYEIIPLDLSAYPLNEDTSYYILCSDCGYDESEVE